MNLERPTRTPKFVEYAVNYALKSPDQEWSDDVADFDPNPIKIPPYQRKIVWDEKTIHDFLKFKSCAFWNRHIGTITRGGITDFT